MIGLFISLALLGLAAIDPIGIAAMPILLLQKKPFSRSFSFLGGSFLSLVLMGLLFAHGSGAIILRFDNANSWLVPSLEVLAGVVLLGIATVLLWRIKNRALSLKPSATMTNRLRLNSWYLFGFGAALVAIQSVIDVVFVIAMIRIGDLQLSAITVLAAVITYSIAALVLQVAVVAAFRLAPEKQKRHKLDKVHSLLSRYANEALVIVSLGLGCGLLINGTLTLIYRL